MNIHNRTCVPTQLLMPIIEVAAQRVEADLTDVTVKFTPGLSVRGTAYNEYYIRLVLPVSRKGWVIYSKHENMLFVRDIFHLLVHELKHVADFQNDCPDMVGINRQNIISSEQRAVECAKLADKDMYDSEEIMSVLYPLADWAKEDFLRKLYPDPRFLSCVA